MLNECVIVGKARILGDIWDNRRHLSLFELRAIQRKFRGRFTPETGAAGGVPSAARQHMLTFIVRQHMLTHMESSLAITEAASGSDPDTGLRAVAALRVLTERLEILQVDNARGLGWSWQQIAACLGVSKQTVHRKHGKRAGRQS